MESYPELKDVPEEELIDLAELFKMFADSTRIKILYDLFQGEKNVTQICNDLEMNQSAVSHQLKILRGADLVTYKKVGKNVFYELADDHVRHIIECALEHIRE